MNLYTINHSFHYELENLTRAFLPNDKITVKASDIIPEDLEKPYILSEIDEKITVTLCAEDFK